MYHSFSVILEPSKKSLLVGLLSALQPGVQEPQPVPCVQVPLPHPGQQEPQRIPSLQVQVRSLTSSIAHHAPFSPSSHSSPSSRSTNPVLPFTLPVRCQFAR